MKTMTHSPLHYLSASLAMLVSSRSMQLLLLFILLLMAQDFSQRLYISGGEEDGRQLNATADAGKLPRVDKALQLSIDELLLPYDKEAKQALAKANEPEQEVIDIDAQQGQLTTVFTASFELSLKGVIDDNGRYALVQAKPRKGGDTSWLKLTPGEQVDGFTITTLELTRIRLERGEQRIELQMYAPLTKPASQPQVQANASNKR